VEAASNFHNFMSGLPETAVYDVRACFKKRHLGDREVIFQGGDEPDCVFQLASGNVALCNYSVDSQEIMLTKYQPGDWFGDASLLRLPGRVIRTIQRLLVSQGKRDADGLCHIECSHDELARYVAASREAT
jgi:hypothetical protein